MRTFAQKQKPTSKAESARSARPGRAVSGHGREVGLILQLQRSIGNHGVQRLLQAHEQELEDELRTSASTRFAHDFSRIPVHADARTTDQEKPPVNIPGPPIVRTVLSSSGQPLDQSPRVSMESRFDHDFSRIPVDWYEGHEQPLAIQKQSLEVSNPADAGEKQADEVARKVVEGQSVEIRGTSGTINRAAEGSAETTLEFQSKLESSRGSGQSLDDSTKREVESKMGADFSNVKVHTGGEAHHMSESINAKAFTHGSDVYFKQGEFNPYSKQGRELLAHELVHTQLAKHDVHPSVQRQTAEKGGQQPGEPTKTTSSSTLKLTVREKHEFVSTVLAESAQGMDQLKGIAWVYYNNMTTRGVEGSLSLSSAYKGKNGWYKGYMTGLGETDYLKEPLPSYMITSGMPQNPTFADYIKSPYYVEIATKRVNSTKDYIENTVLKNPSANPYPGYTSQGYHADFNNETNNDVMWKMARAYYWLQIAGTSPEIYVTKFEAGKQTTFIFNLPKIQEYYKTHSLPKVVPKWAPGDTQK